MKGRRRDRLRCAALALAAHAPRCGASCWTSPAGWTRWCCAGPVETTMNTGAGWRLLIQGFRCFSC
jgi:hypothetical protein